MARADSDAFPLPRDSAPRASAWMATLLMSLMETPLAPESCASSEASGAGFEPILGYFGDMSHCPVLQGGDCREFYTADVMRGRAPLASKGLHPQLDGCGSGIISLSTDLRS